MKAGAAIVASTGAPLGGVAATGPFLSLSGIRKNYPGVVLDDILACLDYAATLLKEERVMPLNA